MDYLYLPGSLHIRREGIAVSHRQVFVCFFTFFRVFFEIFTRVCVYFCRWNFIKHVITTNSNNVKIKTRWCQKPLGKILTCVTIRFADKFIADTWACRRKNFLDTSSVQTNLRRRRRTRRKLFAEFLSTVVANNDNSIYRRKSNSQIYPWSVTSVSEMKSWNFVKIKIKIRVLYTHAGKTFPT